MHPPFYTVDHKIGPDILDCYDSKPVIKRSLPERFTLQPSAMGWPPMPLSASTFCDNGALLLPSGATLPPQANLRITPLPQWSLRDFIGRLLIQTGRRMIIENRV